VSRGRSFSDPETNFYLPHWPYTDHECGPDSEGHRRNAHTGEVVCEGCYESAMDVKDIHHAPGCDQFDVMDKRAWEEKTLEEVIAEEYSGQELQQVIEHHHDELDLDELPCECVDGIEEGCGFEADTHAHARARSDD